MKKRYRTFWIVRRRFKVAQRVMAILGGTVGTSAVATMALAGPAGATISRDFVLGSAALVLAGFVLPWWLIGAFWRRRSWLYRQNWC